MPKIIQPTERRIAINARLHPTTIQFIESMSEHTEGNKSQVIEKLISYIAKNPEAIASIFSA